MSKEKIVGIVTGLVTGILLSFVFVFFTGTSGTGAVSRAGNVDVTFNSVTAEEGVTVDSGGLTITAGGITQTTGTTTVESQGTPAYYTLGGVDYAYVQKSMTAATTTICAIPNPFGTATSSLVSFLGQITTGTTTAANITLATSTLQFATSTSDELVADRSVASGAQDTLSWLPSVGSNTNMIAPSDFVLYRTAGAGLSGYTYTGTCSATFLKP